MKQGLTKREKIFLFTAGVLVLMYLAFQFGFVPLYNNYTETRMERDRLRAERLELELRILNLKSIEEANNKANDEFDEITKDFPLLVSSDEIDRIITNLVLNSGLIARSLNISTSPTNNDSVLFTIMNVHMRVEGSYSSLLRLLDEVEKIPNISVLTMNFSENRMSTGDEEFQSHGTISLNFELIFITPTE